MNKTQAFSVGLLTELEKQSVFFTCCQQESWSDAKWELKGVQDALQVVAVRDCGVQIGGQEGE